MDVYQYSQFTKIFAIVLMLKTLIQTFLDYRNVNHIKSHQDEVPEKFKEIISLEDHQKATNYTIDKINTSKFFSFLNLLVLLSITLGGGLDLISLYVSKFNFGPISTGLIFFAILSVVTSIPELINSLYTTFVIEERYGFNKMTLKIFISDFIKNIILMSILGGVIISVILTLIYNFPKNWWFYSFIFFVGFQILLMFTFPTFIAPLFNKFVPLEDGPIKSRILSLLERVGFKSSGLFVMDASTRSGHGNAYFTGFGKSKRIVFFDTLIDKLEEEEIEAVLAHELGHMKLNHIKKMIIKFIILSFFGFALIGFLMNYPPFLNGHGVFFTSAHANLALLMMISSSYSFFLIPISAMMSRKHEFEADAFAAKYSNNKKLISSLIKLHRDNASPLMPDPLYSKFYYSHPPALERIEHLEKL